ncbi:MAG: glycosyltransferase [Candidatus Omnitrophica bacterium]|nr:glycosyltransferase [Candidatus Omnitrophota bacterium]
MRTPTITVLMTVYNGDKYLKDAIESILKQTYTDFEFLIINDCSRDHSEETIKSFSDKRIRLVNNETNLGQTRSLNKGLGLARGRYIARIDADDLAFPAWLSKNLTALQANSQTAVVSCKAVVIDATNKIQKVLNTPCDYDDMVLRSLLATPLNHVGSVYKTDVIASLGGYDERFRIAADFELWSKLIRNNIHLSSTDEPLVAIRVHDHSISISERGRTDIGEISEIMARNFRSLVAFSVTDDDIHRLWKLNYATAQLSSEEFYGSLSLLQRAYRSLNSKYEISLSKINAFAIQQKRVLYAKRAFSEIHEGHSEQLRVLAAQYRQSEGWLNMFSILWLGSWLGKPFLKQLPWVYQRWSGWSTRKKLQQQDCSELCLRK